MKWKVPTGKILTDSVIDPHENELLTVTGFVRLVKISPDDCDIHIQLGAFPSRHFPQIIAEIPPTEPATRLALARTLGVDIKKSTQFFDGERAVQLTLTGMAFDDSSHWERRTRRRVTPTGAGSVRCGRFIRSGTCGSRCRTLSLLCGAQFRYDDSRRDKLLVPGLAVFLKAEVK